jgi:NADPH-dependent glutamate synthase beta subunit-like oxidoreductase
MPVAGGMMSIGIPEYRLPRAELNRDIQAIRALGVETILDTAIGRDLELTALQNDFDAVLLAVGAQRSQRLDIPGEAVLGGVTPATTFLKEYNLDPETRTSGVVAVIGGGSTAMDRAEGGSTRRPRRGHSTPRACRSYTDAWGGPCEHAALPAYDAQ